MQRLDWYLLRSFTGLFLKTLAISIFFLLMQMVWKYVDDLSGRGVDWVTILELMLYWSASVLPMAVPIAILFAGIMVFGNLAESNEFAAAKSAGASFYRLARPLIFALFTVAIAMFFVANNLIPVANFKGENLLLNIAKQRPTFSLSPGIYYHGIDGYSIKIGSKEGNEIHDIVIYDHKERGKGNQGVIMAPKAHINYAQGSRWLVFELEKGIGYQELQSKVGGNTNRPFLVNHFERMKIRIDMGSFQLGDLYSIQRSNEFNMLNINQLNSAIAILYGKLQKRQYEVNAAMRNKYHLGTSTRKSEGVPNNKSSPVYIDSLIRNPKDAYSVARHAILKAQSSRDHMKQIKSEFDWRKQKIALHYLEYYKKFSISLACILLFFIGASLGAIIQKGGFGLSFVVSVLLFLFHYILTLIFEKMGREWLVSPFWAIWLPNLILMPIAAWLTVWAANDASTNSFHRLRKRWFGWISWIN